MKVQSKVVVEAFDTQPLGAISHNVSRTSLSVGYSDNLCA
jgi:hypothetical protein